MERPEGDFPPEEEGLPAEEEDLPPGGPEDEGPLAESIMALLNRADIEVVDDTAIKENMIKKVTARVARRILKEYL